MGTVVLQGKKQPSGRRAEVPGAILLCFSPAATWDQMPIAFSRQNSGEGVLLGSPPQIVC